MLAANALEHNPDIGDDELLDVLSSNLCRCTGYQNIIKAVRAARDTMRGAKRMIATMRCEVRRLLSVPLHPFAQRMAGRGQGWGAAFLHATAPHPRPLPAASRGEGSREGVPAIQE